MPKLHNASEVMKGMSCKRQRGKRAGHKVGVPYNDNDNDNDNNNTRNISDRNPTIRYILRHYQGYIGNDKRGGL